MAAQAASLTPSAQDARLEQVQAQLHTKKVGILVHNVASMFSNGCIQNAILWQHALRAAGFDAVFLSMDAGMKDMCGYGPVVHFKPPEFPAHEYHTIIYATRSPSMAVAQWLRSKGVLLVGFCCGQVYLLHQERWLAAEDDNVLPSAETANDSDVEWVIPFLSRIRDYYATLKRTPVRVCPHLWDPTLVGEGLRPYPAHRGAIAASGAATTAQPPRKLRVFIVEPNVSIAKTSWLPLVACERFEQLYPGLLSAVVVVTSRRHARQDLMLKALSITAKGIVRRLQRTPIPQLLAMATQDVQTHEVLFLSHQHWNEQNYLHYELLHGGWPLVHNSELLRAMGYFYEGVNTTAAAQAMRRAMQHADVADAKRAADREVLARLAPAHPHTVDAVRRLLVTSHVEFGRASHTPEALAKARE